MYKDITASLARPNQPLNQHLANVSSLAAQFAEKCGMEEMLLIVGFFHDLGKISNEFQAKLQDGTNDSVPHSIFGAKRVYEDTLKAPAIAEMLANIIAMHHGRLLDNISPNGDVPLVERLASMQLFPTLPNAPKIDAVALWKKFLAQWSSLPDGDKYFALSMYTKFAYSCLVDADRLDAYRHESGKESTPQLNYDEMLMNLDKHMAEFDSDSPMAKFRQQISDGCAKAGVRERGVYKLEVPTGGGKTLASLRFALTHAKKHNLDRIIYVIPYLSILEQTADAIRKALGADEATVLEHHSGFLADDKKEVPEYYNLQADRWDAPIILTTQVQFLESIFSAKGSDLRKLHNMANAVIIFDEAQSIPVKCIHLFNGAINFLNAVCGTTVLLCTATQPLLDEVDKPIRFSENPSIVKCGTLVPRTNIVNKMTQAGYSYQQLADFVLERHKSSTLIIVNTKAAAMALYDELKEIDTPVLHLSTNMCGSHRDCEIAKLRNMLDAKEPVICISTQLIEAGVDISLECVIRDVAGLDSILQAAGRCNRHAEYGETKDVYIVNIAGQNLSKLPDIERGAEVTKRLFDEGRGDNINAYYQYYLHECRKQMDYPIKDGGTIYDLLSKNQKGRDAYANSGKTQKPPIMCCAIRSAADAFHVIDRGRKDIVVPYGNAPELVRKYCEVTDFNEKRRLLQQLGKYSVSIYSYQEDALRNANALYPQGELTVLENGFYDPVRGLDLNGQHEFLGI